MITRKTRLTSALLAVLMMMTMLAAFVLPATAEESSPYPYLRNAETLGMDYADEWAIGSAEDWVAAIELNQNGEKFSGKTLHFTADIDFDVDGDGEIDLEEHIDTLGNTDAPFQGNIHGHGHVIENLYVDHDVATEGNYAGLIGYSNKSGIVIRDLGLASGSVNMYGTSKTDENYSGAFMANGSGAVTFANCWTAVDVFGDIVGKELDMAPFGRGSGYTLVNCINTGDMNAKATTTGRTDAFLDWTNVATQVYNCVNMGNLNGTANYFFTFGSSTDTEAEYQQFVGNIGNIYVHDVYSDINKNGIDALLDYKTFEIDSNEYHTGELASKLNDNYVDKFDSLYGRKYFTMNEKGELAMTDDPYDALYKLTISKQIGDYTISSETSFKKATSTINLPVYDGYVLASHTDAIMPDYDANTFRMPPVNAELNYVANVPDWNIIKEMIDKYEGMVESGHAKALNDAAALSELLDKLKLSYAAKDTMSDEQAMARIALYVKDNANLDLTVKSDLTYPNYPLMRYFDKSVSKIWGIKTLEDWQVAVALGEEAKENFNGITIHFLDDVDFKNVAVDPLCVSTGFAGNIEGHGKVIKNFLIDGTVDRQYHGLIARSTGGMVVRDLGIENGTVKVRGSGNLTSGAVYVGVFISQGSGSITFANCWSDVDIDADVEKYEIDAAPFGRTTGATTLINCISNGDIKVHVGGGTTARVDGTFDWNYGTGKIANVAHTGAISNQAVKNVQSYVVGLAGSASTVPEGNITNVFGTGMTGFSSKAYLNEMFPDGQLDADNINFAELAWKMNDRYDDRFDATYGKKFYTAKDGKLLFGTESDQAVRVNLNAGSNTLYLYGFPGDTLELGNLFTMGNPTFSVAESYAASIDANDVLTIHSLPNELEINVAVTFEGGFDYSALTEAVASYDGVEDLDKYTSTLTSTKLPAKLAEVQSKTYTTQAEIDQDVEILGSYFYATSIKDYLTKPTEDRYTVATLEDLEYVAKYKGSLGVGQTIMLTANITIPSNYTATIADVNDMSGLSASINGGGYTLKGIRASKNSWLGNYAGSSISNITFEDCWTTVKVDTNYSAFLMMRHNSDLLIENVTFDGCKNICNDAAGSNNRRSSIVIGNVYGSTIPLTLKNVTIKNCEIVSRGAGNSAFVVGNISATGSKVNIDGLSVHDNLFSGPVASSGCAYLFGENNGTTVVKNAAIFNNSLGVDGETIQGVITGSTKQGNMTLENIMTYNNEGTNTLLGKSTAATTSAIKSQTGIYSDATVMNINTSENRADNSALILSGEAANLINATDPTQTWAMENGLPVFSETGLPVKVTLDVLSGNDVVRYTDASGKLIGLTNDLTARSWVGYDDLANAVFTEDTTVVQADCNHEWVYTNHENGTHTVACTTAGGCGESKTVPCNLAYTANDGVTHAATCADCGYNVTENCTKEISHVAGTYDAASKHGAVCTACGHSTESACSFTENKVAHTNILKGYTEYTCECGYSYKEEEATKAHEFGNVGVTVKAPTYTEAGTAKYKCSICDAYEYREIPALTGTGINVNAPVSAMQGEEITVELELANNAGNVAGMNLQVNYDDAVFSLVDVVDNGIFDQAILPETATSGKVNLTYANVGNLTAAETDGKALATLTFKVLDEAAYGNTEITAEFVKSEDPADTGVVDYDSNFIEVGEGNAVVGIMASLWGDANMDGNVNVADAQTILQWRVGKEVAIDLTAADADRNGEVNVADALLLLQYANQLVEWDPYGTTVKPASQI